MIDRNNSLQSFDQLLEQYEPLIRRIAYSVGNLNDENLLQEIRIGIWEATKRYVPGKGHKGAYMKKMAWGRAMNYMKREQRYHARHPNPIVTDQEGNSEFLLDLLPSRQFTYSIETEMLLQQLDRLSHLERYVIMAFYYYGYDINEIALRLSEPVETIRSRKKRALKKLRNFWS